MTQENSALTTEILALHQRLSEMEVQMLTLERQLNQQRRQNKVSVLQSKSPDQLDTSGTSYVKITPNTKGSR